MSFTKPSRFSKAGPPKTRVIILYPCDSLIRVAIIRVAKKTY